ncbi:hypothetical protein GCM10023078_27080 [Gibbsiella greigii]
MIKITIIECKKSTLLKTDRLRRKKCDLYHYFLWPLCLLIVMLITINFSLRRAKRELDLVPGFRRYGAENGNVKNEIKLHFSSRRRWREQ